MTVYNSNMFFYDKDDRTMYIDASQISDLKSNCFIVQSAKTQKQEMFEITKTEIDKEGDVVCWRAEPYNKTLDLAIIIWNT